MCLTDYTLKFVCVRVLQTKGRTYIMIGFPLTLGSSKMSHNASFDSTSRSLFTESTVKIIPYIYKLYTKNQGLKNIAK